MCVNCLQQIGRSSFFPSSTFSSCPGMKAHATLCALLALCAASNAKDAVDARINHILREATSRMAYPVFSAATPASPAALRSHPSDLALSNPIKLSQCANSGPSMSIYVSTDSCLGETAHDTSVKFECVRLGPPPQHSTLN